ncbi:RNA-directed DNA polymerase, eukaryota, reverse transcriptase zinc-binding domain protein [Tanacetum coccineum]
MPEIRGCLDWGKTIRNGNDQSGNVNVDNHLWVLIGDWNVSLNEDDHFVGGSCKTADMMEFKECIEEIKVEDLNCSGLNYTWIQRKLDPGNGIMKKIDRVVGKNCFMGKFPVAHAMFLPHLSSDHCPAMLLIKKLKALKPLLKELSWKYGNIYERVTKWKGELQNIQARVDASPHDADLKREEARIMKEYYAAVQDEESFLCQQGKIEWLEDGDKNSKFFHAILKARNHKSRVAAIRNEEGDLFEGEKVPDIFVQHFQKFLGSSFNVKEMGDDLAPMKSVSPDDANEMIKEVNNEVIKEDVCLAIREFFKNGKLLGEVNATSISLVPKLETPIKVSDFRPNACCNVIYKGINDFLMFCHGDVESFKVIKDALDEFSKLSRLVPNMGKSTVFFGNISVQTKQEIMNAMPFKCDKGALSTLFGKDLMKHKSINTSAKVIDMWSKTGWRWPSVLVNNPLIQTILFIQIQDNTDDKAVWLCNGNNKHIFATNKVWKDYIPEYQKVPWYGLIWYSHCIPKHSFILWLTIKERLATQDRVMKWYYGAEMKCSMCNSVNDSIKHLFFECPYTKEI